MSSDNHQELSYSTVEQGVYEKNYSFKTIDIVDPENNLHTLLIEVIDANVAKLSFIATPEDETDTKFVYLKVPSRIMLCTTIDTDRYKRVPPIDNSFMIAWHADYELCWLNAKPQDRTMVLLSIRNMKQQQFIVHKTEKTLL